LQEGHTYTIQFVATFDFGAHPCSSLEPGQSSFTVSA
jgi:hypothetical protein